MAQFSSQFIRSLTNPSYGKGLFGEAAMGGLEALLGSGLGQADLMGNIGAGLLSGALR